MKPEERSLGRTRLTLVFGKQAKKTSEEKRRTKAVDKTELNNQRIREFFGNNE